MLCGCHAAISVISTLIHQVEHLTNAFISEQHTHVLYTLHDT